ncbi:glycosyltransferase family 39 protein [bacterium]|nr:glycosyltransferase family 39 protein [bacterium]
MIKKESNLKNILTPLLLALLYLFLLLYHTDRVPLTDDARFYLEAGEQYAIWFEEGIKTGNLLKPDFIDRYWQTNHEHPPFAKLLMASGYLIFHKWSGLCNKILAQRLPISLFAIFILLFLYRFARQAFSKEVALFASLAFIFLPRTLFHARVATLDFAVAGTSFLFVYSYWRGYESKRWAWMTGPLFGLALATKLNAPFMLFPVVIHFLIVHGKEIFRGKISRIFIPQFVSMLLFSLPLFFALWPWMWHHTVDRFLEYTTFHMKHYGILMYYFGEVYREPRPPITAPALMMLITTPVVTLYAATLGVTLYRWKLDYKNNYPMTLTLLAAFISITALMFLPAPFYSGVKLFQPFFPFFAMIAGVGIALVFNKIEIQKSLKTGLFLLLFLPTFITTLALDGAHLSYFNDAIGGTKGAMSYRTERHYYDLFYPELIDWINRQKAKRIRIAFEPNGSEYNESSRILKKEKVLQNSFVYSSVESADYIVLTDEYRWKQYPELLRRYRRMKPVFEVKREGVSLLTVYKKH